MKHSIKLKPLVQIFLLLVFASGTSAQTASYLNKLSYAVLSVFLLQGATEGLLLNEQSKVDVTDYPFISNVTKDGAIAYRLVDNSVERDSSAYQAVCFKPSIASAMEKISKRDYLDPGFNCRWPRDMEEADKYVSYLKECRLFDMAKKKTYDKEGPFVCYAAKTSNIKKLIVSWDKSVDLQAEGRDESEGKPEEFKEKWVGMCSYDFPIDLELWRRIHAKQEPKAADSGGCCAPEDSSALERFLYGGGFTKYLQEKNGTASFRDVP